MTLRPAPQELAARARADLRMGVPVVLGAGESAALVAAAETLTPERLAALRALGAPVLAITPRRAETLKARAYSDHVARLILPEDADAGWIATIADPADDLMAPMKGPFATERGGDETIARAAIRLAKAAHLLPASLVVAVDDGPAMAAAHGLTWLDLTEAHTLWDASPLAEVSAARVPMEAAEAVVLSRSEQRLEAAIFRRLVVVLHQYSVAGQQSGRGRRTEGYELGLSDAEEPGHLPGFSRVVPQDGTRGRRDCKGERPNASPGPRFTAATSISRRDRPSAPAVRADRSRDTGGRRRGCR